MINEVLRNQGVNNTYSSNQNYAQIRSGHYQQNYDRHYPHYDRYTDSSS